MKPMIFLGADHAGWRLKESMQAHLEQAGYRVRDLGNARLDPSDDYADFAFAVGEAVAKKRGSFGILACGNAQGVCIAANKVRGVRAVTGFSAYAAKTSRTDDDANILCLPGRVLSKAQAIIFVDLWLTTAFSGEARHQRRLKKIRAYEA